ncbi:MAG TPA: 16S rRNA (cytidine(1402)-2'-O)-methyltransferase [Candidatus Hydrogenedentes bacterium]|nr:16S rRNA (cytidine(1402)-2'-O)-methyltransferase [Candidatus Hydrogenedentota bacterium]HOV73806.1 16S rRNA (cytidine(1402)-2'-O)-methyltransferase [Candidatus Hydrogenedentota bacterium]
MCNGTLYLLATPIGNLEDLSFRAARILGEVEALACEDTRLTRRIFERHDIPSPRTIFSYHEHNEESAGRRILGLLENGTSVAVCTDGGFPGISDPGYRLVAACRERGFRVEVVPGPSAALTALIASGLPTSSFTFKGFPPRKSGARQRFLEMDRDALHTLVVFESPYRVGKLLDDALAVLGNRLAAVCIELTKKFEEIHRGYLAGLADQFRDRNIKGEVTVVIAGSNPKFVQADDPGGSDGSVRSAKARNAALDNEQEVLGNVSV